MDISNVSQEHKALLNSLRDATVAIDEEKAKEVAEKIVSKRMNPNYAFKYSIADGAIKVGEKFESGDIFLPHLVMAGDLMEEVGKILERGIEENRIVKKRIIVIATVQGDWRGKNHYKEIALPIAMI